MITGNGRNPIAIVWFNVIFICFEQLRFLSMYITRYLSECDKLIEVLQIFNLEVLREYLLEKMVVDVFEGLIEILQWWIRIDPVNLVFILLPRRLYYRWNIGKLYYITCIITVSVIFIIKFYYVIPLKIFLEIWNIRRILILTLSSYG